MNLPPRCSTRLGCGLERIEAVRVAVRCLFGTGCSMRLMPNGNAIRSNGVCYEELGARPMVLGICPVLKLRVRRQRRLVFRSGLMAKSIPIVSIAV